MFKFHMRKKALYFKGRTPHAPKFLNDNLHLKEGRANEREGGTK